jgi:cellulose synthase/poly-beta-1,6-N-acetylglucosamine synthase-like glycosyltransferase
MVCAPLKMKWRLYHLLFIIFLIPNVEITLRSHTTWFTITPKPCYYNSYTMCYLLTLLQSWASLLGWNYLDVPYELTLLTSFPKPRGGHRLHLGGSFASTQVSARS